jgi:hypothetical protein
MSDGENFCATVSTVCNARFSARDAWSEPSAMSAIRSGRAGPLPRWPNAIVKLYSGATRLRTSGAGDKERENDCEHEAPF